MKLLTHKEELIMMAVFNLGEDAYLIAIQDYLSKLMEKDASLTSIHIPLSRLEKNGMLKSQYGEATAIRGGRRKKIYQITKYGFESLKEYKKVHDEVWGKFIVR